MPEQHASVEVGSPIASMQISLVDSSFNQIASGTGNLAKGDLEPGVYELRFSAGSVASSRLISLRAGEEHREVADLAFPAAIPLPGSSTWNESHAFAAIRGSHHIAETSRAPHDGGLLVMSRRTVGEGDPGKASRFHLSRQTDELGLRNVPIDDGEEWWHADGPDWTLTAAATKPGGYRLQTRLGETTTEQSLWVAPGWQTLVFLPDGPEGIVASHMAMTMSRIDLPWDPGWFADTTQATELALAGLRERRAVLPQDFLNLLLQEKFTNPMLGILGAHSMLLDPPVDFELFDEVIDNLTRLVPGMPDVAGLQVLGEEACRTIRERPPREGPGAIRLSWPPMLLLAYTALIRLDATREGAVIVPGSPAETLAGQLIGDSIWTAWTMKRAAPTQTRKRRGRAGSGEDSEVANVLRSVVAAEPKIQRVADYLASIADIEVPQGFDQMLEGELGLPQNVAKATNVPLRSVQDAIEAIKQLSDEI